MFNIPTLYSIDDIIFIENKIKAKQVINVSRYDFLTLILSIFINLSSISITDANDYAVNIILIN
ncbi:TPA: hypothetical protein HGR28_13230 [Escherichia coli]|nr:hypothetical protein CCE17_15300 [Escherichia coli]PJW88676.1 hypothetical protein CWD62_15810 [Escherichia coli]RCB64845.1 hypothetical protein C6A67_13900 [Escherichia coli]RCB78714.1 hypothetical protein C6A80_14880 [Escherichia coli]TZB25838.1 hypothetical protein E0K63_15330 [Escherichia coli]